MSEARELPEIRVSLERVPHGQQAVRFDYPANLGLRSKLGGKPDWIQNDEVPGCSHCGKGMTFVAQIDSIEHDSRHNPLGRDCLGEQDYMFGDVGMIYVFFCFECCHPACVHQCY
jgi:uncharacterized protein YwqG